MAFDYDFVPQLQEKLRKLARHDPQRYEILMKKATQIVQSDAATINHYKNLRHEMRDKKRVHIDRSFVLTFRVHWEKNFILFVDIDHHDNIYR